MKMGMTETSETRIKNVEPAVPVASPVEVPETTTVTQTPQGAGV